MREAALAGFRGFRPKPEAPICPADPGNLSLRPRIGSEGCVLTYRVSDQGEALIRGRSPTAEPWTSDLAPSRPVFLFDLAELRFKLLETLDQA